MTIGLVGKVLEHLVQGRRASESTGSRIDDFFHMCFPRIAKVSSSWIKDSWCDARISLVSISKLESLEVSLRWSFEKSEALRPRASLLFRKGWLAGMVDWGFRKSGMVLSVIKSLLLVIIHMNIGHY